MTLNEGYGLTETGPVTRNQEVAGTSRIGSFAYNNDAGDVRASLVLAAGNIYAATLKGSVVVFKADPARFQLLATNTLGDEIFPTPTPCGGRG